MNRYLVAAFIVVSATTAQAGTFSTCLNGTVVTNYGVSAPYSLRQCFSRISEPELDGVVAGLGYELKHRGAHSSTYYGNNAWLFSIKGRDGAVSEIVILVDQPT